MTGTDAEFRRWQQVTEAYFRADLPRWPVPGLEQTRADLRRLFGPDWRRLGWFAVEDETTVGVASVELCGVPNTDTAWIDIVVAPEHRRRGAGAALYAAVLDAVHTAGRRKIHVEVAEDSAGAEFARRRGYRLVQREPESVLDVTAVDAGWLAGLVEAEHPGYELRRWLQTTPADLLDSYALVKRAMADAPTGGSGWGTAPWDAERVRHLEAERAEAGRTGYVVVAVAADGSVAGLTEVDVPRWATTRAQQEDTVVLAAHRGHGLGLWVKAAMLQWLRSDQPAITEISTWNAETNRHMRAINETLGFRVDNWWLSYVLDLG